MLNDTSAEFSAEAFNELFQKVGMSRSKFAGLIGVSPKTVTNYLTGVHTPSAPKIVNKIKGLMRKHSSNPSVSMDTAETNAEVTEGVADDHTGERFEEKLEDTPGKITPQVLQSYQKKNKLTSNAIAKHLGISLATWSAWKQGHYSPGPKYRPRVLKMLANAAPTQSKASKTSKISPGTSVKSKTYTKRQLPLEKSHQLAQRFFESHQLELNKTLLARVVKFVSLETETSEGKVREVLACSILLLKDRLTFEEAYSCLTGYSG